MGEIFHLLKLMHAAVLGVNRDVMPDLDDNKSATTDKLQDIQSVVAPVPKRTLPC
jgi:hypothetical protein